MNATKTETKGKQVEEGPIVCKTECSRAGEEKKEQLSLDEKIAECSQQWLELVQLRTGELKAEKEAFEAERDAFEAMRAKLLQTSQFESRVRLNVGGKLFVTSLDTLRTREPGSFLAAMFSGEWKVDADDQGAFYIDRCAHFVVARTRPC
jgi:hypothetical protein